MNEFKSKCEHCGELEFNENDRVWTENESCYCRCGNELHYTGEYTAAMNSVGYNHTIKE